MAKNKRNRLQIEVQRAEIEARYCQGELQHKIAESLGLSRQQVGYDLAVIHRRWVQKNQDDIDKRKFEDLAKVDHLEATYWEAWESSKKESSTGNPTFLSGVASCISERCKILGHYAPMKLSMTMEEKKRIVIEEIIIGLGPAQQEQLRRLLGGGENQP